MSWWCISSEDIMEMLYDVQWGADPEIVYMEYYANCEVENYE